MIAITLGGKVTTDKIPHRRNPMNACLENGLEWSEVKDTAAVTKPQNHFTYSSTS